MTLDQEQVAQYLKDHPDFFTQHPELLLTLKVPHPHSGQIISLSERQVLLLRERARVLEAKLKELIQFAEKNDAISAKLHKLALELTRARSLDAVLAALYLGLREDFAVPHTRMRLWTAEVAPSMAEFAAVSDALKHLVDGLAAPRCGHEAPEEVRAWFGEIGPHLHSFAIAPIREPKVTGVLVLASEEASRFYPEMGTLYLSWLAELAGATVSRFIS